MQQENSSFSISVGRAAGQLKQASTKKAPEFISSYVECHTIIQLIWRCDPLCQKLAELEIEDDMYEVLRCDFAVNGLTGARVWVFMCLRHLSLDAHVPDCVNVCKLRVTV
jgi:hypothetical protein